MSNELTQFTLKPTTLTEAMEYSKMIAGSSFCPPILKNKTGDVLICMQIGYELGLSIVQSLQYIAVINGKPCVWGDGLLAVAMSSPHYEYHKEWLEGKCEDETLVAYCLVKRKGSPEYTKSFSVKDAIKANLWKKTGVWSNYPSRMLQMRARGFAIRDQFADALSGIIAKEEIEDYGSKKTKNIDEILDRKQKSEITDGEIINEKKAETCMFEMQENHEENKSFSKEIDKPSEEEITKYMDLINNAEDLDSLKLVYQEAMKAFKGHKDILEKMIFIKDYRKVELENMDK